MGDVYVSPGAAIEQGDIYKDLHFAAMRYPVEFFRLRPQKPGKSIAGAPGADLFALGQAQFKPGDSVRSPWRKTTIGMFISHGCEVEGVERDDAVDRRHWLAAPIEKLSQYGHAMKQSILERRQPNKFLLPADPEFGFAEDHCVDLRYITPLACRYFVNGHKLCSLSTRALLDLRAHLGVFFTGLQLYWEPIACGECGAEKDPSQYLVETRNEGDIE